MSLHETEAKYIPKFHCHPPTNTSNTSNDSNNSVNNSDNTNTSADPFGSSSNSIGSNNNDNSISNVSIDPNKEICQHQSKLVLYWGSELFSATYGNDQSQWEHRLTYYCESGLIDMVVLSFMHVFGLSPDMQMDYAKQCLSTQLLAGSKLLDFCPSYTVILNAVRSWALR